MTLTNHFAIGDKVVYETEMDSELNRSHMIEGVVTALTSPKYITLTQKNSVSIVVNVEYCTRVYSCEHCRDTGEVVITPAYQKYTEKLGTHIVDEVVGSCSYCQI